MFKAVLWDLDGTILDTTELILLSYRHAFSSILKRDISDEEALANFGEPLRAVMARYSNEHTERLVECYREHNHEHHDSFVQPFPGILDALANIKRRGFRQAIVTSKTEWLSRRGLELFGLEDYFEEVVGFESTNEHKPAPEPALEAIKKLKILPEEAIFVGDALADFQCSKAAEIPFVFALWGPNPNALGEEKPEYRIIDPRDILHILPKKAEETEFLNRKFLR